MPELASSVIPTFGRTRGPGALKHGYNGLSQIFEILISEYVLPQGPGFEPWTTAA